ncbi:MAG: thioredoxin [Aquipseudomonas alcaligenes]|jgi:thiol-disulfide isomerase/thioredoxin|uniref:Thioredoxin n=1 Tax=Aquipseudomonas alcaligenes TaxID=43263 RepID=A0A5C7W0F8_AQUAC|nr:MAG: thioredoxin [Pseudomonas alcaligenes]
MKFLNSFFALAGLLLAVNTANALEIAPYSVQTFSELQKADKPVTLHFHAEWCSTCKAQEKVFNGWKGDAAVPGILLIVDYDNERALRKKMGVRGQSTVISFKGSSEKARLAGDTDAKALRAVIDAAK